MMELATIQGALALAVWSVAIYLLLTGGINRSIDVRKKKRK